ncbi:hypothetical protein CJU89_0528 [Yarrowia sp. B02]|nr:hypothetical protein CJU89_0528 [Yarrowia sp. B02]
MKSKTRYHCPHFGCKKSYTRRDYVERHAVNHMVTKPYICLVCDRYFSRADLFEHHMDTKYHRKRAEKYQHPDHPWQAPENMPAPEFEGQTTNFDAEEYPNHKSVASPNDSLASLGDQSDSYFVYQQQKHESSYYYPSQQPVYVNPGVPPVPRGAHMLHNLNNLHQHLLSTPQQTQTASQAQPQAQAQSQASSAVHHPQQMQFQQQPPMLLSQHGPLATQQVYPWLPSQANPIHYV